MPTAEKCLTPECKQLRAAQCKGLCMFCYKKAKNLVESGQLTWEYLADLGMIEMPKDPFMDELRRREKAQNTGE